MTKEELEKEAEDVVYGMEYDTYDSDGHSDFAVQDTLVKFAEPRENRIAELEKENAELKEKYKWLGSSTKCWFRNAPCRSCDEHDERLKLLGLCYIGQLDKAKDIIKNLIDDFESIDGEQVRKLKVVKEAEQFLKEE